MKEIDTATDLSNFPSSSQSEHWKLSIFTSKTAKKGWIGQKVHMSYHIHCLRHIWSSLVVDTKRYEQLLKYMQSLQWRTCIGKTLKTAFHTPAMPQRIKLKELRGRNIVYNKGLWVIQFFNDHQDESVMTPIEETWTRSCSSGHPESNQTKHAWCYWGVQHGWDSGWATEINANFPAADTDVALFWACAARQVIKAKWDLQLWCAVQLVMIALNKNTME